MRYPGRRRSVLCAGLTLLAGLAIVGAAPEAGAAATPKTVSVQVVPQLPNVTFTLDGQAATTDQFGRATVTISKFADVRQRLLLPTQLPSPTLRVSKDRVANDPNHPASSRRLVVELDEDRPVTINLLTPQRKSLSLTQVSSVTLEDSLGATIKLTQSQLQKPVWLPASRPHRVKNGVTGRQVAYSVRAVTIRGVNVVNSGQLRYTTDKSLTWSIPVILHSLTIDANDLLAGRPAGTAVDLTYPNGTTRTVPLGPDHRVTVANLARGTYRVKVDGGLIPLASTVHLSRDQTATELVVTTADFAEMLAIVLVVVAVIAAAGIIGRRRRRDRALTESEPSEPERSEGVAGAALA